MLRNRLERVDCFYLEESSMIRKFSASDIRLQKIPEIWPKVGQKWCPGDLDKSDAHLLNLASRWIFYRDILILHGYFLRQTVHLSRSPGSHICANLEGLRRLDFRGQKISDESNFLQDKSNQRIPIDSACFCLHRVLNAGPVPIPIFSKKVFGDFLILVASYFDCLKIESLVLLK